VTPVATKTVRQTVIQPVSTSSDTRIDAQESNTQISVAQIAAAMASSGDQYLVAPDSTGDDGSDVSSDPASDSSAPPTGGTSDGSDGSDATGHDVSVSDGVDEATTGSSGSTDDADGDGCSDSYDGACVDPYVGKDDVNCDDVTDTDFDSVGDDPYELDADGDGTACESY
jgi:hypothetical protein